MKIAVISSHTPSLFWFRMDMMLEFIRRGSTVIAIGNEPESKWAEEFRKSGIRYLSVPVQKNGTNPIKDLETYRALKRVLATERPDKVFTYQAKTVIYGGMAAHKLGIGAYPLIAGVGSVFLSSGIKASVVRMVLKTEYRVSMKHAEKVFFQNPDDVKVFTDNKIISADSVVMLNGSGVNLNRFKLVPLPEKPVFLCVSRLIRDKGVGEYLQAAKSVKERFPEVRFLLVGPYDTNPSALTPEELKPYIDDGVIEYFGEQMDVRPYLAECSIFVLPSYREGTPKAVLEAMACGRAVLTTDVPGCRETVKDGENGYLVPVKDVSALVRRMEELIQDPGSVKKMGASGRKLVEEKFDVDKVNDTICRAMGV